MMWRHRFIIDHWVWELPGGYVEETCWRPRNVEFLTLTQPVVGSADAENLLYVAHGADQTDGPTDINEASRVAWIPLDSVMDKMAQGEIVGAASQVGLLHVLARRTKSS